MNAVEILGSLLGGKKQAGGGNILADILGGVLGGGKPASVPQAGGGGLTDMLKDAYSRFQNRSGAGGQSQSSGNPVNVGSGDELDDERAVVLIRAMINAAKADGQLDDAEKQAILKRLGNVSDTEAQFLRTEFARPLEVRDFTWSVPLGLEQQVYTISLMAINLDQDKEASYLKDLAHGLRLTPDVCKQIHKQYNAPQIFA